MGLIKFILYSSILYFIYQTYASGRWESLPILNNVSGEMRFKELICDPLPLTVNNMKGGYTGKPAGVVSTYFTFDGGITQTECLNDWQVSSLDKEKFNFLNLGIRFYVSHIFESTHPEMINSYLSRKKYILVDGYQKQAYLYVPNRSHELGLEDISLSK